MKEKFIIKDSQSQIQVRNVMPSDLPKIIKMYDDIFNIKMSVNYYNWLYRGKNHFYSRVVIEDSKIVAHMAIIEKKYFLDGEKIVVGISSGSMVNPNYSGVYLLLIKKMINSFTQDIIIAFPNKNSIIFFDKLLQFDLIQTNYFTIKEDELNPLNDDFIFLDNTITRDDDFIRWRLVNHPKNNYYKITKNSCEVYYKKFKNNSIDIVYSSKFDHNFYDIIKKLLDKYKKINIIHWDKEWIESLGFKEESNNTFVYKWNEDNNDKKVFECQMIDSDVY